MNACYVPAIDNGFYPSTYRRNVRCSKRRNCHELSSNCFAHLAAFVHYCFCLAASIFRNHAVAE